MEGQANEQPYHLDGTIPWATLEDGKKCTALSCVVLLSDGPGTVLGRMLSNFWVKNDEEVVSFLNEQVQESINAQHKPVLRRAGHVVVFPLGQ